MSGESHIVAVDGERQEPVVGPAPDGEGDQRPDDYHYPDDTAIVRRSRGWIVPALAGLAVIGWTAVFIDAYLPQMRAGAGAAQWVAWIADWAVPVALVVALWILALRHSRAEAGRFADAAASLRDEAAALEQRVARINGELSIARDFLTAQGRDLDALGRVATERLGEHAGRLEALVSENGARVETLREVSAAALDNMEQLKGRLPIVSNVARDLTNFIGQAGRGAQDHVERLVEGFERLNHFGQASELRVDAMRTKIDEALAEFSLRAEQLGDIADARFAALGADGAAFRERLDHEEAAALDALRARAAALGGELDEARQRQGDEEERAIAALRARIDELERAGDALSERIGSGEAEAVDGWRARIASLVGDVDAAFGGLDDVSRDALDAAGARIAALAGAISRLHGDIVHETQAFDAGLAERVARADGDNTALADRLRAALVSLDDEIAERQRRHEAAAAALALHADAIAARLTGAGETMEQAAATGEDAENRIVRAIAALNDRLGESREALAGTDGAVAALTENSVRLLELINSSADHARDTLPAAIAGAEQRLDGLDSRIERMRELLDEAGANGRALGAAVATTHDTTRATLAELDGLHDVLQLRGALHFEQLEELHGALERARRESDALAGAAEAAMSGALAELAAASRNAAANLEESSAEAVRAIVARLRSESGAAVGRAIEEGARDALDGLENAATRAGGAAREATIGMRDQLIAIDELTGHLEARIAQAREKAEADIDDHFARRVAQITESLNSTAIDIDKAISSEVSDAAWKAYLRGERGIFTRRAVRLLDNAEARAIYDHYRAHDDFREHVNRYIHDFEAMLRHLLSTREGQVLGVTVLSSDMGKLYVALAQAIERLRK